jgi:hypothetical protein
MMFISNIIVLTMLFIVVVLFVSINSSTEGFVGYNEKHVEYKVFMNTILNPILQEIVNERNNRVNKRASSVVLIPSTYNKIEKSLETMMNFSNNPKIKGIFAIDGCDIFASKKTSYLVLKSFYNEQVNKYIPETHLINEINIFRPKSKDKFICKKDIQRKKGIEIFDTLDEVKKQCTEEKEFNVVQKYVHDTLTIRGKKMCIRIYILVKCEKNTNQPIFYIHKSMKCLYSDDKNRDITSSELTDSNYENVPQIKTELYTHLDDTYGPGTGKKTDQLISELMKKVCYPFKKYLGKRMNLKSKTRIQLFGCDLILTKAFKPLFLEANKGPSMKSINSLDYRQKHELVNDTLNMFESNQVNFSFLV